MASLRRPPASPSTTLDSAWVQSLRTALLRWYTSHRRDLPWRGVEDSYAIWVSEVMLQQTQVERVIPFYRRFLDRFPTLHHLASASLEEVMSAWRGLGYYARARGLHRCAVEVEHRYQGTLPPTVDELLTLPGFGRYTAGAVASIAFGQRAPVVDGNVARVLSRVLEIDGAPDEPAQRSALWQAAEALVPPHRPGDFNQALMELGATVCLPTSPLCLVCPVHQVCGARRHGRTDELPKRRAGRARQPLDLAVAVAQQKGNVLLARRPPGGLFGALWEMPGARLMNRASADLALRGLVGPQAVIGPEMGLVERTLTHLELRLHLHPVKVGPRLGPVPQPYVEWRWVPLEQCASLGMSAAMETALTSAISEEVWRRATPSGPAARGRRRPTVA